MNDMQQEPREGLQQDVTQQGNQQQTDLQQGNLQQGQQQPDLVVQIFDATKVALDGAGDAYRDAFKEIQGKLPTFDEVLAQAVLLPGTRIDRIDYLAKTLGPKYIHPIVRASINVTPAAAGLSNKQIEKIAKRSIGQDGRRTTALSFAAGIPGGVAAAATIPADLIQFYGYLIRSIQKLSYLYGWRDLVYITEGEPDIATAGALVVFLGVMAGIPEADAALARLARLRSAGATDDQLRQVMAERSMAPQIKLISDGLTRRMARRLTGQVAGHAIPLVGGIVSGVMTGSGFDEMARRLLKELKRHGA
jgi:hypothetical protein